MSLSEYEGMLEVRWERVGSGLALAAWFAVMAVVGAGLLARHVLALPTPTSSPRLAIAMSKLGIEASNGRWLAVHVLSGDCRCSQRVVEHLLRDRRPQGWSETVLWTGAAPPPKLNAALPVIVTTVEALAQAGIEGAPLLLAVDPRGEVRYAGGYTDRKQGAAIRDREILDDVRAGNRAATLPLFGCATSVRLRTTLARLPVLGATP